MLYLISMTTTQFPFPNTQILSDRVSDEEVRTLLPEVFKAHSDADPAQRLLQQCASLRKQGINTLYELDGKLSFVSPTLVISRKLSAEQVDAIRELHIERGAVFATMHAEDDSLKLQALARRVEMIEFELQSLWTFPIDAGFHDWYKVPRCVCPKMDNNESKGTKMQIITTSCPIHGSGEYEPGVGWRVN